MMPTLHETVIAAVQAALAPGWRTEARYLYVDMKLSTGQIAQIVGVTRQRVHQVLRKQGIAIRSKEEAAVNRIRVTHLCLDCPKKVREKGKRCWSCYKKNAATNSYYHHALTYLQDGYSFVAALHATGLSLERAQRRAWGFSRWVKVSGHPVSADVRMKCRMCKEEYRTPRNAIRYSCEGCR